MSILIGFYDINDPKSAHFMLLTERIYPPMYLSTFFNVEFF